MSWTAAVDGDHNAFKAAAEKAPGWYWVLRPQHVGPQAYDAERPVAFLVLVGSGGQLSSPMQDLRTLDDVVCVDASSGGRFGTWFAGPISAGELSATVTPASTEVGVRPEVEGTMPRSPGWHWCRTEPAPLMLVDASGAGPVFLQEDERKVVEVYLCATLAGEAVDVGEFAFCEPLVSEGGVIDSSGMVGRERACFHGAIPQPQGAPSSLAV